jgi:hypothetical protein
MNKIGLLIRIPNIIGIITFAILGVINKNMYYLLIVLFFIYLLHFMNKNDPFSE